MCFEVCCVLVHQTPKYGLIFHASLIGQAPPKYKGKISRVLAAKCALSVRVDALGEQGDAEVGLEGRQKVSALVSSHVYISNSVILNEGEFQNLQA
jgi:RNA processing factor Prp31